MLIDPRLAKLAEILVTYSTEVREGDKVLINGSISGEPLLREVYREVLRAGGLPHVQLQLSDQEYIYFQHARDKQLDASDALELYATETFDVFIRTFPDTNPHALTGIDSDKKQRRARARQPIIDAFVDRWGKGDLRWVASVCPTDALAQEARMSLPELADFVFKACAIDRDDPAAHWREVSREQEKYCERLNAAETIRYVGQETDLTVSVKGRTWLNCDGRVNFPDGEVFTGPVEDSANGTIRFTYPGIYLGEAVEDIFLRFEAGVVVEARAARGQELLEKVLDVDEGSRRLGEIAIGTNYDIQRFTKNMLFDEKMGGTVHLAVGRGMPPTGSVNRSSIHWDMLKEMRDGGEVYADEELIYESGKFLIG